MSIVALAATTPKGPLAPFEFDPGALRPEQVEIKVDFCGICHSDQSMLDNEWGMTKYPFVPGHEVSGTVAAVGNEVKRLKVGQRVGLGWYAESCMTCPQCMSGNHNLCATAEQTIVQRHGGFAQRVRCHWAWALPLPEALDPAVVGPLFCGGLTVFNPIVQFNVKPTDRVGVIGIGGLGHLALQFLNKWGCEVTAFSSNPAKRAEVTRLGAHNVVDSRDASAMQKIAGSLDFIISTVSASLDWQTILGALAPKGRLHIVGVPDAPISLHAFPMIAGQKSMSGSPLGSPDTARIMLEFCARHKIAPITETFPMSKANEAIDHLRAGKARYRIVLKNDL
jgi:uncharacterized zinc-type alcohol dehydrogenase-like protein